MSRPRQLAPCPHAKDLRPSLPVLLCMSLLVAIPARAQPDLIVESITVVPAMPEAGSGTIEAVLKNIGDQDVDLSIMEFTNVEFLLDGVLCDTGTIPDLSVGASTTEDSTACIPSAPGTYSVIVVVDSDYDVAEANEANNALAVNITWRGPDLVFTALSLSPDPAPLGQGTLTATLANQGVHGTDTFASIDVHWSIDGITCDTDTVVGGIAAAASVELSTSACHRATPGAGVVRVDVDGAGEIAEEVETNNSLSQSFDWSAPDLTVTALATAPAALENGAGTLTATVLNQGAFATGLVSIDVGWWIGGVACDSSTIPLGLDLTSVELSTSACNPVLPGTYSVEVQVDMDDEVTELSESNNSFTQQVTWTSACDLGTDSCAFDATCSTMSGGYACACNAGFTGDGFTCVPVADLDAGAPVEDGGPDGEDAAQGEDAAGSASDAGDAGIDAGGAELDAAGDTTDASPDPTDAAAALPDTGAVGSDAGGAETDAASAHDAAVTSMDSASPASDAATTAVDSAAPRTDAGSDSPDVVASGADDDDASDEPAGGCGCGGAAPAGAPWVLAGLFVLLGARRRTSR